MGTRKRDTGKAVAEALEKKWWGDSEALEKKWWGDSEALEKK